MGDFIKYGRAWLVASIVYRGAAAVAVIVAAAAIALGDGGTLVISWNPGGES